MATSIRIDQFSAPEASSGVSLAESKGGSRGLFEHALALRTTVFVEEQRVPVELEFDGLDGDAIHFLAWRIDGVAERPVGAARSRDIGDGQVKAERVCVLSSARGTGVGAALMSAVESDAKRMGFESVLLSAQVPVIPFYEGLGYRCVGEVFVEANIDHRKMTKSIAHNVRSSHST